MTQTSTSEPFVLRSMGLLTPLRTVPSLVVGCLILSNCGSRTGLDEGSVPWAGGRATSGGGWALGGSGLGGSSGGGRTSGGASSGGQFTTGGVPTTGGAGIGGSVIDGCRTPTFANCESGPVSQVFFDEATFECKATLAHCPVPGSGEMFDSVEQCLATCPGAIPGWNACDTDAECALATTSCCGPCGIATLSDFVAQNVLAPPTLCPDVLCGACPGVPEVQNNLEYFWPACEDHFCRVVDLSKSEFAKCAGDDDCYLREGTSCCGSCDGQGYVPLSSSDFLGNRCEDMLCERCDIEVPSYLRARCDSSGQCIKTELLLE